MEKQRDRIKEDYSNQKSMEKQRDRMKDRMKEHYSDQKIWKSREI